MSERDNKILILDGVHESCAQELDRCGYSVTQEKSLDMNYSQETLPQYEAVVIRSATKLTGELIERGAKGNLKLIVRVGAGVDNIDLDTATRCGVIVENTPGTNARAVIELTMAALLAMARNTIPAHVSLKSGKWGKKEFAGTELSGKTLGIIGLGKIGRGVAELAQAFGMNVVGSDPLMTREKAAEFGVNLLPIDQVYSLSDYLTLHASLNDDSRGMLNSDAFAKMKKDVCVVNCARAELVDTEAMLDALSSGKVKWYFTDVFEKEPPQPDDPIVTHPRVLVTPHVGGSTRESGIEGAHQAAEQIKAFLSENNVINAVNFEPGDPQLKPWEELAAKLGNFMFQFMRGTGEFRKITVSYNGKLATKQTNRVTSAFFMGFMRNVQTYANIVNAKYLARDEGIEIIESKTEGDRDFLEIVINAADSQKVISGTYINGKHILQTLDGYSFDIVFEDKHFILSQHSDVPGIVGIIGTVLGTNKINIQKMGLQDIEGRPSVAIISTREEASNEILEEIASEVHAKGGTIALTKITL